MNIDGTQLPTSPHSQVAMESEPHELIARRVSAIIPPKYGIEALLTPPRGARTAFVKALCRLNPELEGTQAPKVIESSPLVPHVAIQNKYLPEGLLIPQNSFPQHGLRDTEWLKRPFMTFEAIKSGSNDRIMTVSQFRLDFGTLQATYYTASPQEWNSPSLRRTFIMAGRKENALVPAEEKGGRVILVIPKSDRDKRFDWIAPERDILVIEKINNPLEGVESEQDFSLLSVRRLAVYLFAQHLSLAHLMMLDDNVQDIYLSSTFSEEPGWKNIYELFQRGSQAQDVPYLSLATYRPDRDEAPYAEEILIDCPKFNSKIVFIDIRKLFTLVPEPKHLLPVHLKYWGEDYFRQYVLHFAGARVGVFDPNLILIRRSKLHQNQSKKTLFTADLWLEDNRDTQFLPSYVQEAYHKMRSEVERNLRKCVPEEDEDDQLAQELERELEKDQEVQEAFDLYDAYQNEVMEAPEEEGEPFFYIPESPRQEPTPIKRSFEEFDEVEVVESGQVLFQEEVKFPEQNPNYPITVAVQKRYFEEKNEGKTLLQERWEILFMVGLIRDKSVNSMFPVHYVLDREILESSPLKDDEKRDLSDPNLKNYLTEHLVALRRYLGLSNHLERMEPMPLELIECFMDKAQVLLNHRYGFLHLPDLKKPVSDFESQFVNSGLLLNRLKSKDFSYSHFADKASVGKKSRNEQGHLTKFRSEFSKPLKTRILQFNPKLKALRERGYDPSKTWNEAHPELLGRLAAQDAEDKKRLAILSEIYSHEGKGPRYLEEMRALVPARFQGSLMPYQLKGFLWGKARIDEGIGVVLCDDMGLGKTIQALALLAYAQGRERSGPTLILCPSSVVHYWKGEIAKFLPYKKDHVVLYEGGVSQRQGLKITPDSIVLATYEMFRNDAGILTNEKIKGASKSIHPLNEGQIENLLEALVHLKWMDYSRRLLKKPVENEIQNLDLSKLSIYLTPPQVEEFKKVFFTLLNDLYLKSEKMPLARVSRWHSVLLDEAHHIKNNRSLLAETILNLSASHKIALSGTPVQNTFSDLLPIMNFAIPGFFLGEGEIKHMFLLPIKTASDAIKQAAKRGHSYVKISDRALLKIPEVNEAKVQMEKLKALLAPFLLRRTKEEPEILAEINKFRDVPGEQLCKSDLILPYHLTHEQHLLVEYVFQANKSEIEEHINHVLHLFTTSDSLSKKRGPNSTKFLQIQQLCTDPQLLNKNAAQEYLKVLAAPLKRFGIFYRPKKF